MATPPAVRFVFCGLAAIVRMAPAETVALAVKVQLLPAVVVVEHVDIGVRAEPSVHAPLELLHRLYGPTGLSSSMVCAPTLRHPFRGWRPYRVLYAFDPRRTAMLLVGGDKTGNDRW